MYFITKSGLFVTSTSTRILAKKKFRLLHVIPPAEIVRNQETSDSEKRAACEDTRENSIQDPGEVEVVRTP